MAVVPESCPLCQNKGLLLLETGAMPCKCVQEKQKIRQRLKAGLSPEMWEYRFDRFSLTYYSKEICYPEKSITYYQGARRALQAAKEFIQEFTQDPQTSGLMLVGPVGSGKTYLAAAICNALLDRQIDIQFLVVPDFLDELRASFRRPLWVANRNEELDDNEPLIERVRSVPLLVLDDLGAHNYTEWTRNTLYTLLNYRLNYRLPVIITTNLGWREMDEVLGERITSRIIQLCRNFPLMVETDIRHLKFQQREARYRR